MYCVCVTVVLGMHTYVYICACVTYVRACPLPYARADLSGADHVLKVIEDVVDFRTIANKMQQAQDRGDRIGSGMLARVYGRFNEFIDDVIEEIKESGDPGFRKRQLTSPPPAKRPPPAKKPKLTAVPKKSGECQGGGPGV